MTETDEQLQRAQDFFHVSRVVPDDQVVVTVPPTATVDQALQIMEAREFSQVPIVNGPTVIGVFSTRSLAARISKVSRYADPLECEVVEFTEDLKFVRPRETIGAIVPDLSRDGAVFMGADDRLLAVITLEDVVRFLWGVSEPFMLIQDIELAARRLISQACPATELSQFLTRLPGANRLPAVPTPDDLTFGQLLGLLRDGDAYSRYFSRAFGRNNELCVGQLAPIRAIRNRVFHFNGQVESHERDQLVSTRRWLQRKSDILRKTEVS